jgi:hypothetical protein
LYDRGSIHIDNGKQTTACGQNGVYWVTGSPILEKLGNLPCFKVKREKVRELLDTERAGSHRNALEETMGEFPVCFVDVL